MSDKKRYHHATSVAVDHYQHVLCANWLSDALAKWKTYARLHSRMRRACKHVSDAGANFAQRRWFLEWKQSVDALKDRRRRQQEAIEKQDKACFTRAFMAWKMYVNQEKNLRTKENIADTVADMRTLRKKFTHWRMMLSEKLRDRENCQNADDQLTRGK